MPLSNIKETRKERLGKCIKRIFLSSTGKAAMTCRTGLMPDRLILVASGERVPDFVWQAAAGEVVIGLAAGT
jgi:hypothetical protein